MEKIKGLIKTANAFIKEGGNKNDNS